MRSLVAESKWTGHHLFFAAGIAEALADDDHEIVLAVTNSTRDPVAANSTGAPPTRMASTVSVPSRRSYPMNSVLKPCSTSAW